MKSEFHLILRTTIEALVPTPILRRGLQRGQAPSPHRANTTGRAQVQEVPKPPCRWCHAVLPPSPLRGRKTTGLGGGAAPRSWVGQRPARGLARWRISAGLKQAGPEPSRRARACAFRTPDERPLSGWARTAGPEGKAQTLRGRPRPEWERFLPDPGLSLQFVLRAALPGSHLALKMTDCTTVLPCGPDRSAMA
uniref:uncharacterized protein LOC103788701 isoform X2 n=1 Tax=Callithrix jacchus TaxID=9483 RepID=UPI0023DD2A89|nr:uncharacterized protein LOC103788701 isoform X2 [Callithrix jacchus]